jgi:hypothetical protein
VCNRTYRLLFGIALLLSLYFDSRTGLYSLIALALFEAISNLRVPRVIRQLRHQEDCDPNEGALGIAFTARTRFEAERGWRLLVATFLTISIVAFPETLWFVPWFMGFAIMGAGISGVCPVFLALKWAGLR